MKFVKHDACWDLEKRGGVGETPFHLLYLNYTPAHLEIAKCLLRLYPKMALDYYEGEEYYGKILCLQSIDNIKCHSFSIFWPPSLLQGDRISMSPKLFKLFRGFKQNGGAVGQHSNLISLKKIRRPKY